MIGMKERIGEFWKGRRYAVVGVSHSGKGFGYMVYHALKQKGYEVVPVNAAADTAAGDKCYRRLADLPERPDSVLVVVPAPGSEQVVRDCAALGIRRVWLQEGAQSAAGIQAGEALGLSLVHHACAFMYMPGTSFPHACHRFVAELFGKGPQ